MRRIHLVVCAVPFLASCGVVDIQDCTLNIEQSVQVIVRDSLTGAPAAEGARGTLREGTYADTLIAIGPESMQSSSTGERPGVYDVTIDKPGYLRWTRQVRATKGECHVQSETPVARLRRAP